MSIQKITASDITSQIHSAVETNGTKRKGRIATLNKIAEIGKTLLDGLNAANKEVVDIIEDLDNISEQMEAMERDLLEEQAKLELANNKTKSVDLRIEQLKNIPPEELTPEEQQELQDLYAEKTTHSTSADNATSKMKSLENSSIALSNKISDYSASLNDTIDTIAEYTEAGGKIKEEAKEVGRDMNVEKALKRNAGKKTENYVTMLDYETLNGAEEKGAMTYEDTVGNKFVAKYDVIEAKGGRQINGKMRKETAKAYSYGQTIEDASAQVKQKAENAKNNIT